MNEIIDINSNSNIKTRIIEFIEDEKKLYLDMDIHNSHIWVYLKIIACVQNLLNEKNKFSLNQIENAFVEYVDENDSIKKHINNVIIKDIFNHMRCFTEYKNKPVYHHYFNSNLSLNIQQECKNNIIVSKDNQTCTTICKQYMYDLFSWIVNIIPFLRR